MEIVSHVRSGLFLLPFLVSPTLLKAQGLTCRSELPESLISVLTPRFVGFSVYELRDLDREMSQMYRDSHGDRCPGSVSGDFDGDGRPDYAALLLDREKQVCQLVAAVTNGSSEWTVQSILAPHPCVGNGSRYVAVVTPGHHESMVAGPDLTNDLRVQGYVESYDATTDGVYLGAFETEGTAFFLKGRSWVRLEW